MFTVKSGTRSTSFRLKLWEEQLAMELGQRAFWPRDQGKLSPRADICTESCSMKRPVKKQEEDGDLFFPRERGKDRQV